MSTVARKSGNRTASLRERAANSIAGWDDTVQLDANTVFLPVIDAEEFLERMDHCIDTAKLTKLDHAFLDGGVWVRFRRKHDADVFRAIMAE